MSKGAAKDIIQVIAPVASSVYKVYDYLAESPACNQTRDRINEFLEKSKRYNLAKAEVLNIINITPVLVVEIDPIIEHSEDRFGKQKLAELVTMVVEVLPPPPTEPEPQEGIDEDKEEIAEEEQIDEDGKKDASDEGETGEDREENAAGEPIDEDDKETTDGEPINGDKEVTAEWKTMEAS